MSMMHGTIPARGHNDGTIGGDGVNVNMEWLWQQGGHAYLMFPV